MLLLLVLLADEKKFVAVLISHCVVALDAKVVQLEADRETVDG